MVSVAVLAIYRRASEPVDKSQVDELRDKRHPHHQIKNLRMVGDHRTLPGTVARTGGGAAISARSRPIATICKGR
jgi:hypothetical protein